MSVPNSPPSNTLSHSDNAGGSQVLKTVVDYISDYLLNTNVQLGADYSVSTESTRRVSDGPIAAMRLFNAASPEEIVFGASSTMNLENLARALEDDVQPGDEIIITGEHEANVGPWKKLASRRGAIIKHWKPTPCPGSSPNNPYAVSLNIADILPLVSPKTRLLAFPACSNILGSVVPVKEIVQAVRNKAREHGARKVQVSVDCVAYAPHRQMDVQDWDVDFCVFSYYKIYGPHISALYVRSTALEPLTSLAHHFLSVTTKPLKLEPGGPGYELVYGTSAVLPYLLGLTPARSLEASFAAMAAYERALVAPLLDWLRGKYGRGVRIVGEGDGERVPTVSFVVVGQRAMRSRDVVGAFDRTGGIGIRWGHFYAYTLVDEMRPKMDEDGVVRISLIHYNTAREVERIIGVLEEVLA